MLSGKDIIGIIRAGKAAKVATLELNGFKVTYQGSTEAPVGYLYTDQHSTPESSNLPTSPKAPDISIEEDLFTDPVAYEDRVTRNDIE